MEEDSSLDGEVTRYKKLKAFPGQFHETDPPAIPRMPTNSGL